MCGRMIHDNLARCISRLMMSIPRTASTLSGGSLNAAVIEAAKRRPNAQTISITNDRCLSGQSGRDLETGK